VNEQHILNYEIEYSADGINFTKAGTVAGRNNNIESLYQFNHDLGSGNTHYFRLRIIEANGAYSFSQVISINKKCSSSFSLEITPNPVTEKSVIKIIQPSSEKTTVTILNVTGSVLYQDIKMLNAGENMLHLNMMNKFAPGTYLLRITNSNGSLSKKFIKI
jgi:hypothetical protein